MERFLKKSLHLLRRTLTLSAQTITGKTRCKKVLWCVLLVNLVSQRMPNEFTFINLRFASVFIFCNVKALCKRSGGCYFM